MIFNLEEFDYNKVFNYNWVYCKNNEEVTTFCKWLDLVNGVFTKNGELNRWTSLTFLDSVYINVSSWHYSKTRVSSNYYNYEDCLIKNTYQNQIDDLKEELNKLKCSKEEIIIEVDLFSEIYD